VPVTSAPIQLIELSGPVSHPFAVTSTHHTPQIPDNTDVDCFVTVDGGALNAFSKCKLAGEATTDPLPVRRCGCLPLPCVEKSANQRIFLNFSLDSNFSL